MEAPDSGGPLAWPWLSPGTVFRIACGECPPPTASEPSWTWVLGGEALPGVENLRRFPASLGHTLNLINTERVSDGFGLAWLPVNSHTEDCASAGGFKRGCDSHISAWPLSRGHGRWPSVAFHVCPRAVGPGLWPLPSLLE